MFAQEAERKKKNTTIKKNLLRTEEKLTKKLEISIYHPDKKVRAIKLIITSL